MMPMDPAPIQNEIVVNEKSLINWQRWFRQVADWIIGANKVRTWAAVVTGATGTAALQTTYAQVGSIVYFQVSATPSGTFSATSGSTTVSLPIQGQTSTSGVATVVTSISNLTAIQTGQNLSLPTFSTTAGFKISGAYLAG
ncbi:hypothetical protein UFOVP602_41 [uncultured Caudovirales phage]|uniref:Uncharacterized protein n=1 Tax=uncultured Caudovirales phage TaxID=2100421 RepID=A0A6J5N218_9CAUD|nr:hypothetical protein UFOVP602_41 [uncultured Caudovirales phage]